MKTTMTRKELSFLTQKQIREYAVMRGAKKVPKKWTDKNTALDWIDKNLRLTKTKTTKKPAQAVSVKAKPKAKLIKKGATDRRKQIVQVLKKEAMTATELSSRFGVKYKSILDDMHAIRHNRITEFIKKDEVLTGVFVGSIKVFKICKRMQLNKVETEIKESITVE